MSNTSIWTRNLKIRFVGETIFQLFYWMYFPFIALYFGEAFGLAATSLLMMLPPIISLVATLIGGALADKYGRKRMMLVSTATQFAMFMLFALSGEALVQYGAFLGIAIGTALYKPASDAMVADTVQAVHRKEVFAMFLTGNNIGAVIGPVVGATLFFHYRTGLLLLCATVVAVYFIVIYYVLHETLPKRADGGALSSLKELVYYGRLMRDRTFITYIVAGVFSVIAIMQLDLYFAVYMYTHVPAQQIGYITLQSEEILSYLLALNGLLFVVLVLPMTKWLKTWHDRHVLLLSCALAGLGMFAVGLTTNVVQLFLCTAVFTIGEIVRAPVLYNFVSEHAPANARAQYMAAANMQFTIGRLCAPVTVLLAAFFEPIIIFSFILLCVTISALLYAKLYR